MKYKILAIDDDEKILRLIGNALEANNFHVETRKNIEEINICDFTGFDLILLGLENSQMGMTLIDGKKYSQLGDNPFCIVGSFLDSCQPYPTRTGFQHLRWIGLACGVDRNRCKECLELVGLSEAKNKKVKDYSLGMKQRLGLATALLANPDILILDEPINGLDPEGIRWVRNFLQSFVNEGKTVLMTSHYMSELELTVDHLVGISNGKIVIDAPTKDILKQFGSFEEAYFKALEGKEGE